MNMTDSASSLRLCVRVNVCVRPATAMAGSQLLLRARSPRSSLRPRSFDRDRGHSQRVLWGGGSQNIRDGDGWYLLDLRVGSGCRADLTAWTRRLVDERARRTGPLCLRRQKK